MAGGWSSVRCPCSGLLVLWEAETWWGNTFYCGSHGHAATAATATAATQAFLEFRPSFGQQLLLCVTVGQGADARV